MNYLLAISLHNGDFKLPDDALFDKYCNDFFTHSETDPPLVLTPNDEHFPFYLFRPTPQLTASSEEENAQFNEQQTDEDLERRFNQLKK